MTRKGNERTKQGQHLHCSKASNKSEKVTPKENPVPGEADESPMLFNA